MIYATTLELNDTATPVVIDYDYDEPIDVSLTLTPHYTNARNTITRITADDGRSFDCSDDDALAALTAALDCDAEWFIAQLEAEIGRGS